MHLASGPAIAQNRCVRKIVVALGAVVLGLLLVLWHGSSDAPADAPDVAPRDASAASSRAAHAAIVPAAGRFATPRVPTAQPPPPVLDSLDPCRPVEEPELPDTFETRQIANNITLAWHVDPEVKLRAAVIGRVAQGIAEEAAEATGTTPRDHLTVVIYASISEFHDQTHAPPWSAGLYDGAVRIPYQAGHELGIAVRALRHEIMHAQLHAGIGCMPTWFDEGIATYFAGDPDVHELFGLLREGGLYEPEALGATGIADLNAREPSRVYAQAVAMVMYAIDHDGDLRTLVATYRAAPDTHRAEIWQHWFPDGRTATITDFLARRLFGQAPGPAVDAILHGTVCCAGTGAFETLACRAPASPRPERTVWIDRSRSPPATCSTHY